MAGYVHGYSAEEAKRLYDQARTIADLLHWDSYWEPGTRVLEVGCGVGAQTRIIALQNPEVEFVAVDVSEKSLAQAEATIQELGISNVTFQPADVLDLPFEDGAFDHVFICFVLEHLLDPAGALREIRRVLSPHGSISVVEGDHGSTYFYPDSEAARKAVQAQVSLQKQNGGNANMGRELYPLLTQAGFHQVEVTPRPVYVDASKPELVEGFIKHTFTAMIQGITDEAVAKKVISQAELEEGIKALFQTAEGGTFNYTFFKATGRKE
ncbi:MAG TPA: SAM-dependent methyltransferase [Cytophagales bacterium]|nr:SAM-dependent methyltransferase [Cytophagales bacterium]